MSLTQQTKEAQGAQKNRFPMIDMVTKKTKEIYFLSIKNNNFAF